MSSISTNFGAAVRAGASESTRNDPDAALRRLKLSETSGKTVLDVVQLEAGDLGQAVRAIDSERQSLESAHARASSAVGALQTVEEKLTEIGKLTKENAKRAAAKTVRRANQTKIDALLKDIEKSLGSARDPSDDTVRLFDGALTLTAAGKSVEIPKTNTSTLGRLSTGGRTVSLEDLTRRGALSTVTGKASRLDAARRSVEDAKDAAKKLRESLESFATDTLRPRLGDVATVMEAMHQRIGADTLGSSEAAQETLQQIRSLVLKSATTASIVGAEDWDRERLIDLLQ